MRFSIDGKFIYLLNELSLCHYFRMDSGQRTAKTLTTEPALSEWDKADEPFTSAEILVHSSGRLYIPPTEAMTVSRFNADPNSGKLKVVQVQPVRGAFPRNINLTPDATGCPAGADSNTVAAHQVDPKTGNSASWAQLSTSSPIASFSPIRNMWRKEFSMNWYLIMQGLLKISNF